MALNESYNDYNNNKKSNNYDNNGKYHPTVYSPYKMSNVGGVDPSVITFDYWRHFLRVSIALCNNANEVINSNYSVRPQYDFKKACHIYLNLNNARIFYNEIKKYMENPDAYTNAGVPSGSGIITISNGAEFGADATCITIRLVGEDGKVSTSYVYQMKKDYFYSVRNYSADTGYFEKIVSDYNLMEVEQICDILKTYIESMTFATAYTVVDAMKYDTSRTNTKLDTIASKLGISFGKNSNAGGASSYFSKGNSYSSDGQSSGDKNNYESGSINDLDDM